MKKMILEILRTSFKLIFYRLLQLFSAGIACFLILLIFALFSYFSSNKFRLITLQKFQALDFYKMTPWQTGQFIVESFFIIYLVIIFMMILKDFLFYIKTKNIKE